MNIVSFFAWILVWLICLVSWFTTGDETKTLIGMVALVLAGQAWDRIKPDDD